MKTKPKWTEEQFKEELKTKGRGKKWPKRNQKAHFSTSLGRSPTFRSQQPLRRLVLWTGIPKRIQERSSGLGVIHV